MLSLWVFVMKVYFMRHGESEYNVNHLINQDPKIKINLTEKGVEQAKGVAEKLKNEAFDIIFVSEFLRTQQTAEIVNKFHNSNIQIDKMLNEAQVGFEGRPNTEYREAREKSGMDLFHFKIEGKESWQDVKNRMNDFLNYLKGQDYGNVLVVTHQWPVFIANDIINNLSDEESRKVNVEPCSFLEFEF